MPAIDAILSGFEVAEVVTVRALTAIPTGKKQGIRIG